MGRLDASYSAADCFATGPVLSDYRGRTPAEPATSLIDSLIGPGRYRPWSENTSWRVRIEQKRHAEAGREIMRVANLLEDKAAAQQLEQAGARRTA